MNFRYRPAQVNAQTQAMHVCEKTAGVLIQSSLLGHKTFIGTAIDLHHAQAMHRVRVWKWVAAVFAALPSSRPAASRQGWARPSCAAAVEMHAANIL
jgi:hypothetical protein